MSDGTTHYENCWQSGAKHYACAIKELADCSAAFDRQQEMLDRNAEQIAALRDKLAKEQSEYICTCGIRVTPHKCPTNNGF